MKWLMTLLLALNSVFAQTQSATYEVSFNGWQSMGIATAQLQTNADHTYAIHVEAKTIGLAKVLSNNRIERYESRGEIKNGRLIPHFFAKHRITNKSSKSKSYTFDHAHKRVEEEVKSSTRGKEMSEKKQSNYYAPDDVLTLFFNLKHVMKEPKQTTLYAIGGNKTDGRIDVKEAGDEGRKVLGEAHQGEKLLAVILNDRIFTSAKGELLIKLDAQGLCENAVLKDVVFFGDIIAKRVQ